jgi:hypothetical protein
MHARLQQRSSRRKATLSEERSRRATESSPMQNRRTSKLQGQAQPRKRY